MGRTRLLGAWAVLSTTALVVVLCSWLLRGPADLRAPPPADTSAIEAGLRSLETSQARLIESVQALSESMPSKALPPAREDPIRERLVEGPGSVSPAPDRPSLISSELLAAIEEAVWSKQLPARLSRELILRGRTPFDPGVAPVLRASMEEWDRVAQAHALAVEEANQRQREWLAARRGQTVNLEDCSQIFQQVRDLYDPQFDRILAELGRSLDSLPVDRSVP